jgi:hypothetical protein
MIFPFSRPRATDGAKAHATRQMGTFVIVASLALASCANERLTLSIDPMKVNRKQGAEINREVVAANTNTQRERLTSSDGLAAPLGRTLAEPMTSEQPPELTGDKISVNFEGIRLLSKLRVLSSNANSLSLCGSPKALIRTSFTGSSGKSWAIMGLVLSIKMASIASSMRQR